MRGKASSYRRGPVESDPGYGLAVWVLTMLDCILALCSTQNPRTNAPTVRGRASSCSASCNVMFVQLSDRGNEALDTFALPDGLALLPALLLLLLLVLLLLVAACAVSSPYRQRAVGGGNVSICTSTAVKAAVRLERHWATN